MANVRITIERRVKRKQAREIIQVPDLLLSRSIPRESMQQTCCYQASKIDIHMSRNFYCYSILAFLFVGGSPSVPHLHAMQSSPQERMFRSWDKNRDGVLERQEIPPGPRKIFDRVDRDQDGRITLVEHLAATASQAGPPTAETAGTPKRHTIRQSWDQEKAGFDREFFVHTPVERVSGAASKSWPVTFVFHGNGGSAQRSIGRWPQLLEGHLIVAPQGYQRSWNISDEKSKAPDVDFFNLMIQDINKNYAAADLSRISLIGFSNGAGFIFRLLIELDGTIKITNAVPLVSSMVEQQYHDQQFWKRANDSSTHYDRKVVPATQCNLLTVHGTADRVVPYTGGMRGRNAKHLSAQRTAYAWAKQQGYTGDQIADKAGTPLSKNIIRYNYEGAQVTHLKVVDGGHGLGPASRQINELVRDFVRSNLR